MKNLLIRDLDKNPISYDDFINKLKDVVSKDYNIFIGSDSQMFYEKTSMVCAICFHKHSVGAGAFYIKEKIDTKKINSLRERMMMEAFKSIEIAFYLQEILDCNIEVHLDIGADPKRNKTSKYKSELTSMVEAQGFECKIKPKSWAANVADWFTKT